MFLFFFTYSAFILTKTFETVYFAGVPGLDGRPGLDGLSSKGEKGQPGLEGLAGQNGLDGPKGEAGIKYQNKIKLINHLS